mmetsp:Transcript_40720/g.93659  ORF Transcript_40720/g.93659 Transcript_40720/m.93659 type:complete len:218 (+) Transcript_40720:2451-3104(+)
MRLSAEDARRELNVGFPKRTLPLARVDVRPFPFKLVRILAVALSCEAEDKLANKLASSNFFAVDKSLSRSALASVSSVNPLASDGESSSSASSSSASTVPSASCSKEMLRFGTLASAAETANDVRALGARSEDLDPRGSELCRRVISVKLLLLSKSISIAEAGLRPFISPLAARKMPSKLCDVAPLYAFFIRGLVTEATSFLTLFAFSNPLFPIPTP